MKEMITYLRLEEQLSKKSKDFLESSWMHQVHWTTYIIKRLNNYNVGRIKVDLKYLAKNAFLIEKCIKLLLSKNKVYENKEIFKIEPLKLKKVINKCYCKNVTSKQNDKLYEELSDLLKLYSYTKDKINIKPFIIIDK